MNKTTTPVEYWRTRDGRIVAEFTAFRTCQRVGACCKGADWFNCSWPLRDDGSQFYPIEHWTDHIEFDCSCLPKWAKWVCMDYQGIWIWARIKNCSLVPMGQDWGYIPCEYWPTNFTGTPEQSLHRVENGKLVKEEQ